MLRFVLFIVTVALTGCSSCGEDTPATNNDPTNNDIVVRPEQDAGTGPCQGCFDENDECQEGESDDLCGAGGTRCSECDGDTTCNDDGQCVVPPDCTPDTCDGCCNDDDECVAGSDTAACGMGGARCSECPEGGDCVQGACTFGCGPDNCNGCCDATGTCQEGTSDDVCGAGGGACTDCVAAGSVCGGGACVAMGCSQTCAGCCDGDQCTDPATNDACGADGVACVACGTGESCVGGTCTAPDGSTYDLILVSADIPSSKRSGFGWDTFGGLPDVIAYIYATDPMTQESWFDVSTVEWDTLTPEWNTTIVSAITTSAISDGISFEFWDQDDAFDDEICFMDVDVDTAMLNGQVIETSCDYDPIMTWRWRLEPTP